MTKYELKSIINECIDDMLDEGFINRLSDIHKPSRKNYMDDGVGRANVDRVEVDRVEPDRVYVDRVEPDRARVNRAKYR